MDEEVARLKELFEEYFGSWETGQPAPPLPEELTEAAEDVSPEDFTAALREALIAEGLTEAQADEVIDAVEAEEGWGSVSPTDTFEIVVNNNVTNIDQSIHADQVHGNLVQQNTSTVANATGEGSVAGDEVAGNQVQTGDGQQVGGDSGVQNQGDNSGQQAGANAHADNVTSGSNNEVASDEASGVGDGHTTLSDVTTDDSSLAFGTGSATTDAANTTNLTHTESFDDHTSDSYNTELSDDDSQYNSTSINTEPDVYEEPVYAGPGTEDAEGKGHGYHEKDDYDPHDGYEDDYDVDQSNSIVDVN